MSASNLIKIILLSALLCSCVHTIYAQTGELESSFGINGIVTGDFGSNSNGYSARQALTLPDQSMYVIAFPSSVIKLRPDGLAPVLTGSLNAGFI